MRIFFILCISFSQAIALGQIIGPEVVLSGGENQAAGNVSLSWSLGEVSVITLSTGNNFITQGFQQSGQTFYVLPVELLDFRGHQERNQILLNWETAFEQNNALFTVEKSDDLFSWQNIGELPGAGTSNEVIDYQFFDPNPQKGINHFRLKQTDFNGRETYSEILAIHFKSNEELVRIYPNPVSQGHINLSFSNQAEIQSIQLFDLFGRQVKVNISAIDRNMRININHLAAGRYHLCINLNHQIIHREILIVR